ncbi:MAG: hypothetical protein JO032_15080 [Alphaproteobacteria bacterium]|nr:hypothetical protein [Alphaproteobacteria bacterium]
MAGQIVVGIFESRGLALDARNRLHTEGVPERDLSIVVLREIAPAPASVHDETAALSVDPLVLGDVEKNFARYIKNGETAVLVRAETETDIQFATDVMALYAPIVVEPLRREAAREI